MRFPVVTDNGGFLTAIGTCDEFHVPTHTDRVEMAYIPPLTIRALQKKPKISELNYKTFSVRLQKITVNGKLYPVPAVVVESCSTAEMLKGFDHDFSWVATR